MSSIALQIFSLVIIILMGAAVALFIYGSIRFKKPYLILLLVSLVLWPFAGERINEFVKYKVLASDDMTLFGIEWVSYGELITKTAYTIHLIQGALVLASAIVLIKKEKRANQRVHSIADSTRSE